VLSVPIVVLQETHEYSISWKGISNAFLNTERDTDLSHSTAPRVAPVTGIMTNLVELSKAHWGHVHVHLVFVMHTSSSTIRNNITTDFIPHAFGAVGRCAQTTYIPFWWVC